MPAVDYRRAELSDLDDLARLRSADWGTVEYWRERIRGYMTHAVHPTGALEPRAVITAHEARGLVGFVAGHLTTRYGCHAEVEWLNVAPRCRRMGIATGLLRQLFSWFAEHHTTLRADGLVGS